MDDQNKGVNERWTPATTPERGYATDESPAGPRTSRIREEIERTRADMGETVDAIQERLRPGNVASRAAESVRDATVGKVKEMANSAQKWGSRTRYGTDGVSYGLIDRIRDHPVPATLAAVSLAWLAFAGRRYDSRAIYGSTRDGEPFIRETQIDTGGAYGESHGQGYAESGTGSTMRHAAEDATARAQEVARDATARAQEAARDASAQVRRTTRRAKSRLERMAYENPLGLGALAAAVGATVGLALPETHRENELMGEAREAMLDRAKATARGAAERVQDAAEQAQKVAGEVLAGTEDRDKPYGERGKP